MLKVSELSVELERMRVQLSESEAQMKELAEECDAKVNHKSLFFSQQLYVLFIIKYTLKLSLTAIPPPDPHFK